MRLTIRRAGVAALAAAVAISGSLLVAPSSPASAQPDTGSTATVYYWNDVLLEVFRRQGGGPTPLARAAAMMHAGIFDAFNTADWRNRQWVGTGYDFYSQLVAPSNDYGGYNWAAGMIAREVLTDTFPAHTAFIEQAFVDRHGTSPPQFAPNVVDQILPRIRSLRANDGSGDTTPYQFQTQPGAWQLTDPTCNNPTTDPVTPNWGNVTPFAAAPITDFTQELPGGHTTYAGLLGSQLYADNLEVVKELGRFDSATRTAEQEEIAWFWGNDLDGTYKPVGQMLDHTRIVAQQQGVVDGLELARLFAQASLALADAGIAAWYQKYQTSIDLWRPETAIQQAANDGNPATDPDPGWLPLLADEPPSALRINPCFPAWVSGHATFAAAWAGVMGDEFGDNVTMTLDSEDPRAVGVQRTFTSFTDAAAENALSRIYLGVHFPFDAEDGLATGFAVADHVTATELGTLTCNAPPGVFCW
jgi:hypothetical protein